MKDVEPVMVIHIPTTIFTAYKSCEDVTIDEMLKCIGYALYKCATSVFYNNQMEVLMIYSKCKESDFEKLVDKCCKHKCHCPILRPAYRFETIRNVVWDFVSFRILFPK